jgi:IS1 family transposase
MRGNGRFRRNGQRKIQRFPYVTLRFICIKCGISFSSSFFSLSFRDHLDDIYEEIFDLHCMGVPKRTIAKRVGCSEASIRQKVSKLARWSLARLGRDMSRVRIDEPIAYDGLENFSFSQYDPNNLNHAIGKLSHYTYDFNFSPMNRKGRMSERQVLKKRRLEEEYGFYPKRAIQSSTKKIFERLVSKAGVNLELHSDNHFAYREVISKTKSLARIHHMITPAKLARCYRNRLFAVNHLDLLTRQKLAAFKRETIAFSKTSIAMQESFAIFTVWKNYIRTIFEKEHVRDPLVHRETPAMRVGLEKKPLRFSELFRERITLDQAGLHEDWLNLFRRIDISSRRPIKAYFGI